MKSLIPFLILILTYGGQAWADCRSDCQEYYQSSVESCKIEYDDPADADDLKTCMDDAKNEYDSCLKECETEANTTDVRIGLDKHNVSCNEKRIFPTL